MLLQVKASLQHGEWLPWLHSAIECGDLKVAERTAHKYMRIASNSPRGANLLEAPSDKEPEEQQGTLIDVEAERKARLAAEQQAETERQAREIAERRSKEWNEQYVRERDAKRAAQQQIDLLKAQPAPEPAIQTVEVIPADYESAKEKSAELQAQTDALQKIKSRPSCKAIRMN